jgi:hypothetical protein
MKAVDASASATTDAKREISSSEFQKLAPLSFYLLTQASDFSRAVE